MGIRAVRHAIAYRLRPSIVLILQSDLLGSHMGLLLFVPYLEQKALRRNMAQWAR